MERALHNVEFQLINLEGMREIENYIIENKHHSNHCCRKEPLIDAKIMMKKRIFVSQSIFP